jgi:hypothetical protein
MLDKCMNNLSTFINDKFIENNINSFFENSTYIDSIELAEKAVKDVCCGYVTALVFENSVFKNRFMSNLATMKPNINIINCNCSADSFSENTFNGFLVFNNLKFCHHKEIIEEIKKHKGVLIC